MKETEHKSFDMADEVRDFPNGRAEILKVGGADIGRLVLQPGWRWSNDVKPIAQTESMRSATLPIPRQWTVGHPNGRRLGVRRGSRRRDVTAQWSRRVGGRQRARGGRGLVRCQLVREVTSPTNTGDPTEVVAVFGAAWANHDLDAALELVTEDCVFDNTSPAPDGSCFVVTRRFASRGPPSLTTRRRGSNRKKPFRSTTGLSNGGVTRGRTATCAGSMCFAFATERSPRSCRTSRVDTQRRLTRR